MRILWLSNASWASSGYGVQTKLFCKRIQRLGHEVAVCTSWGLQGGVIKDEDGITAYPRHAHAYGMDVVGQHAKHFRADIVITLLDAWVMDAAAFNGVPWCPWFPIDHDPCPPLIAGRVREAAFAPIVYSKFGLEKARECGIDALYVPHGVDTSVFRPMDKAEARKAVGWAEDKFVVGVVAANTGASPSRKSWPEIIDSFALFAKSHKDALLYCHTNISQDAQGVNIPEAVALAARRHGVADLEQRVAYVDQYMNRAGIPPEHLRTLYSAFDVLLSPSMGEGFGVPILEAQACGTPVIVGDWTSMPELCFSGWQLENSTKFYTGLASYQFTPDVEEIATVLGQAYMAQGVQYRRDEAVDGAQAYDADKVTREYWRPALTEIERRLNYSRLISEHVTRVQNAPMPAPVAEPIPIQHERAQAVPIPCPPPQLNRATRRQMLKGAAK